MYNARSDSGYIYDFFDHKGVPGDEEEGDDEPQGMVLRDVTDFSAPLQKAKNQAQGRKNQEQRGRNQNQNQNQRDRNQRQVFGFSESFTNRFMFNQASFYVL